MTINSLDATKRHASLHKRVFTAFVSLKIIVLPVVQRFFLTNFIQWPYWPVLYSNPAVLTLIFY